MGLFALSVGRMVVFLLIFGVQTQYSIKVPEQLDEFTVESIYSSFKKQHEAIIIAVQKKAESCKVNPSLRDGVIYW